MKMNENRKEKNPLSFSFPYFLMETENGEPSDLDDLPYRPCGPKEWLRQIGHGGKALLLGSHDGDMVSPG
jgi:hypothetical protein